MMYYKMSHKLFDVIGVGQGVLQLCPTKYFTTKISSGINAYIYMQLVLCVPFLIICFEFRIDIYYRLEVNANLKVPNFQLLLLFPMLL